MMKPTARSQSLTSQDSCSAVIIADLIADVPVQLDTPPKKVKASKEETNFGFDGHLDGETSPAVVSVETEVANKSSMKTNGASISKGVILNAVQFGKTESNGKVDEKPIQLTNDLSVTQPTPVPSGFKDMSVLRKMAFIFSFLPSILFVLCFAVILPCNVPIPCVEELWHTSFPNAESTSSLVITPNVAFTLSELGGNYFMTLSESSGSEVSKIKLSARATYLNCGKVLNDKENHCVIMDETGNIHVFNSSDGGFLWDPVSGGKGIPALPVILPDCSNDGFDDIVVAVNKTHAKVMYEGNIYWNFEYDHCDSVPSSLIPWKRNDSSDIIVTCKKGGKDTLVKIPQSTWCRVHDTKKFPGSTWMLHPKMDSAIGYNLHPTGDGLVMWAGDEVSVILPDGDQLWKISNDSHSDENRFILDGSFTGEDQQIVLLSSDISSRLQVTILNSSDGSVIKSKSFPNSEATDVLKIQGNKRDFLLILLKKSNKNAVTEALEHIDDISTTIVNYIANEEFNDTHIHFSSDISKELAFLDLKDGSLHSIREIKSSDSQGFLNKVTVTAAQDKEKDLLHIYLLTSIFSYAVDIKCIKVANWDISASKSPECALK